MPVSCGSETCMLKSGPPGLKRPKLAEHLIVAADLTPGRLRREELTQSKKKKKSLGLQEKKKSTLLLLES